VCIIEGDFVRFVGAGLASRCFLVVDAANVRTIGTGQLSYPRGVCTDLGARGSRSLEVSIALQSRVSKEKKEKN